MSPVLFHSVSQSAQIESTGMQYDDNDECANLPVLFFLLLQSLLIYSLTSPTFSLLSTMLYLYLHQGLVSLISTHSLRPHLALPPVILNGLYYLNYPPNAQNGIQKHTSCTPGKYITAIKGGQSYCFCGHDVYAL